MTTLVDRALLQDFTLFLGALYHEPLPLLTLLRISHCINHIHDYKLILSLMIYSSKFLKLEVVLGSSYASNQPLIAWY